MFCFVLFCFLVFPLEKSVEGTGNSREGQDSVTSSVDTLQSQLLTSIPDQVSDTVGNVEEEWESQGSLDPGLGEGAQAVPGRNDDIRVEAQVKHRGEPVGTGDTIEDTGQQNTTDTMHGGQVPGQLWLVDG